MFYTDHKKLNKEFHNFSSSEKVQYFYCQYDKNGLYFFEITKKFQALGFVYLSHACDEHKQP